MLRKIFFWIYTLLSLFSINNSYAENAIHSTQLESKNIIGYFDGPQNTRTIRYFIKQDASDKFIIEDHSLNITDIKNYLIEYTYTVTTIILSDINELTLPFDKMTSFNGLYSSIQYNSPSNTIIKNFGQYQQGKKESLWVWTKNDKITQQGYYKNDQPIGEWIIPDTEYDICKVTYQDNQYEWDMICYDDQGRKRYEAPHHKGFLNGVATTWYSNGKKYSEQHYINSLPHGTQTIWYQNGNKHKEYQYKQGVLDGRTIEWQQDGSLASIVSYKKGTKHGLQQNYSNGKITDQYYYQEGKKQGTYINNKKEDKWSYWDKEDKQATLLYYDNDIPNNTLKPLD
ncbi:hypothetical protein MTZ49_09300 [Entomomonas sp. E2T0]|uniref:toxin-antitoxin system YwqK family antitoxin n=1 Tax=Entomomonas sp. E2T0 TaxID=2930213 RepID=UPI002228153B|nr:hypothetical protein [Entomomonas sp. E2T0]UYZ82808.1 hypothetical protein MTZ49_09300 [Entomomonas sp. E2T0]